MPPDERDRNQELASVADKSAEDHLQQSCDAELDTVLASSGQSVIDLLEVVRVTNPGQLADLALSSGSEMLLGNRSAAPSTLRIGRFEIERELGRGGHGIVFLAYDPSLNRRVALKVPRPEALISQDLRRRFLREAEAAAALNHPHIVPIFEQGMAGPICFVASAYCEGPSLATWIEAQEHPIPPRLAAGIVQLLADAVFHAHQRGVLHRDIKPANVLWEQSLPAGPLSECKPVEGLEGQIDCETFARGVRLTDFGLARIEGTDSQTLSQAVLGTPAYMAPEQAAGRNAEVNESADIYGLGATLYQLLTLRPPFSEASDVETLHAVRFDDPNPPRRIWPGIPRDVEAICLKCLEKEPRRRYRTAADLAADLGRFVEDKPVQARPVTAGVQVLRWYRRNPALASISAIALLGLVCGTAAVFYQWRRAEKGLVEQRRQADRANAHFQTAKDAVDELLTEVAVELRDLPQTESVRKRLLAKAAEINERFLRDETANTLTALEAIRAWQRAAEIHNFLGDREAEKTALTRTLQLCDAIPMRDRSDDLWLAINDVYFRNAAWHADEGNDVRQAEELQKSLKALDFVSGSAHRRSVFRRAEIIRCLGIAAESNKNMDEAMAQFRAAVIAVDEVPEEPQELADFLEIRAKTHGSLAIHCKQSGLRDEASAQFALCEEFTQRLLQRFPQSTRYQDMLAKTLLNQANLEVSRLDYDRAYAAYRTAADMFAQLAIRFPLAPRYRSQEANCVFGLATIAEKRNRPEEAERLLFQCRSSLQELCQVYPDVEDYRAYYSKALRFMGKIQTQLKDYDAARENLRKSIDIEKAPYPSDQAGVDDRTIDAMALSRIGRIEMDCENWNEAAAVYREALAMRKPVLEFSGNRHDQGLDMAFLALAIARGGEFSEAVEIGLQIALECPDDWRVHVNTAEVFVELAGVCRASQDAEVKNRLAEIQRQAMAALQTARRCGLRDPKFVRAEKLRNELGEFPEYVALAAEVEASGPSP